MLERIRALGDRLLSCVVPAMPAQASDCYMAGMCNTYMYYVCCPVMCYPDTIVYECHCSYS